MRCRAASLPAACGAASDRRGHCSRTRLEWILLDWAIMSIGAVVVGLYPTNTPSECAYVLDHSEAVLALVEDDGTAREARGARLAAARAQRRSSPSTALPALEEEGRNTRGRAGRSPRRRPRDTDLHLRHDRPAEGLHALAQEPRHGGAPREQTTSRARRTRFSSSSRWRIASARIAHHSTTYRGATLALCADVVRVPEALASVQPTILPAVPRVYEKIHAERPGRDRAIQGRQARDRPLGARRRKPREPAPPRGEARAGGASRAGSGSPTKLVFSKVRERLGGRLRLGVSGAAPLGIDVLEFFHSLGMLVDRGLRPDRDLELAERQRSRGLQVRHRRPRRRRLRGAARRRRRDSRSQRDDLRRVLQGPGGDGGCIHR